MKKQKSVYLGELHQVQIIINDNKKMKKSIIFIVVLIIATQLVGFAQVPTKWRGPNSNGIYNETGLLKNWPGDGPQLLWHSDSLGLGHSSPVFANDKIFVSGMEDSIGYIFCLDLKGKLIWKSSYGPEFTESYPGARTSPVVAADDLYMYSAMGNIVCMDANSGSEKWKKNAFTDFDGENIKWGVTETLVIDGDKLYCTPGGKTNNLVALNRHNGDLIWTSAGEGEKSAYCSPLLIELPARKLLVTMTENHILGVDAANGKKLWSYEQTNRWSVHANTPLYHDGGLLCFSGYGRGAVKLKLLADGSSVSKEWFSEELDSRMGGAVLVDGYVYGSGDNNRSWKSLNWKTGEIGYSSTDIAKGAVIYADGLLFCYSERGELAMVEANPSTFKILGTTKITLGSEQHWAHPVINNGQLFIRHGNTLMAFKIK